MKRLIRWFGLLSIILVSCLGLLWGQPAIASNPTPQPMPLMDEATCPELAQKIDLNNDNIIAFKECQGFYPSLASMIVNNGPYEKVEDVLQIEGLSDRQKALLKAQLKNFTITDPVVPADLRMPPRPMMR